MILPATWFDGDSPVGRPVELDCSAPGEVRWADESGERVATAREARVTRGLACIPRFVWLPGGGRLEIPWDGSAEAFWSTWEPEPGRLARLEGWFESRWRFAAGIAAALVLLGALGLWKGVPLAAKRLAYAVPPTVEALVGKGAMRMIRTSSEETRQAGRIRGQLERLKAVRRFHVEPKILFIHLGQPNAFALPGGDIVVTSELADLRLTDDQIAAVLAHELGHEELRHGLRELLQGSSALLAVALVTGDLSTLTSLSGGLPFTLVSRGYSRDFEREADAYAVGLMRAAKIDPESLVTALERLGEAGAKKKGATAVGGGYLGTHPSNEERIRLIRAAAKGK